MFQKVPQASEHLCPAKLQTRCDICCACESVCPSIPTDSEDSRSTEQTTTNNSPKLLRPTPTIGGHTEVTMEGDRQDVVATQSVVRPHVLHQVRVVFPAATQHEDGAGSRDPGAGQAGTGVVDIAGNATHRVPDSSSLTALQRSEATL